MQLCREIKAFLRSDATFVRANVYDLPSALGDQQFGLVVFWGVLYHLRHPVLALGSVRAVARGTVLVETAVADHAPAPELRDQPLAHFYPGTGGDPTNRFAPTLNALDE